MKYRKRPVVIEAWQFETNNDTDSKNMNEIVLWINQGQTAFARHAWHNGTDIFIQTLEGTMTAVVGDWIIRGVQGEYYPCKPDIFEMTYEKVEECPLK